MTGVEEATRDHEPQCSCAGCEKKRVMRGQAPLNPSEARGKPPEQRPAAAGTEQR
jgi:hypothetical protein